jgi:hypothetical protein
MSDPTAAPATASGMMRKAFLVEAPTAAEPSKPATDPTANVGSTRPQAE